MARRNLVIGASAGVAVTALVAVSVVLGLMAAGDSGSDGEIVSGSPTKQVADPGAGRPAARVMELVTDDGSGPVAARIEVLPSPDLPDRRSDASGILVRRQDNSIFIGTGSIEMNIEVRQAADGPIQPTVTLSSDGPEVEAVVTHDTVLYLDVTEVPGEGGVPVKPGDQSVTQVIKRVDSLDELKGNAEVSVWGTKRADRVVADILVFRLINPDIGF